MTPLAISPPSSTPEPDMSSIPQDAATIPHSATPQVLTGRTHAAMTTMSSLSSPKFEKKTKNKTSHNRECIHSSMLVCFSPVLVCIYINKQANTGPNLDRKKIQQLPDHFGPDRPSVVLQQAVQGCIDSAFQQKTVFTLLTQGYGGEKISGVVQRPPSGVGFSLFSNLWYFCYLKWNHKPRSNGRTSLVANCGSAVLLVTELTLCKKRSVGKWCLFSLDL